LCGLQWFHAVASLDCEVRTAFLSRRSPVLQVVRRFPPGPAWVRVDHHGQPGHGAGAHAGADVNAGRAGAPDRDGGTVSRLHPSRPHTRQATAVQSKLFALVLSCLKQEYANSAETPLVSCVYFASALATLVLAFHPSSRSPLSQGSGAPACYPLRHTALLASTSCWR
jgi:hypothetical protein